MWVYSIVFIKLLVGNLNFIVTDSSQPKIFGSKLENRKSGIIHKVPIGEPRDSLFTDLSAKNIRFKIRKIENLVLFIKVLVG